MKTVSKKTISLAVASAMILSMSGCSLFDKSKDEVLETVDGFAKNLASCNVSKIAKGSIEDFEDVQEDWEEKLTFSSGDYYDSDAATAAQAIADTISYEVDEESVEASKKTGEGSVDVVFTIADYEPVVDDDDIVKVEDFVDAIEDADTQEITITIEFEKDEDEWLCSNYEEIFDELYAFTEEDYEFRIPIADMVTGVNWFGCDWNYGDSYYTNTTYIDVDLAFDWSTDIDYSGIYYTVEYQGQELYRETGDYMGYFYSSTPGAPTDETGYYLAAGEYTITFYDADDSIIWSGVATVYLEEVQLGFEPELDWWFTDNYDDSNPVYTNTDVIDGELQYTGNYDYSTGYFTVAYNGEVIYTEYGTYDAWVHTYDIDNCPLDGDYFAAGEYTITFYDADGNMLVSDSCTVNVE